MGQVLSIFGFNSFPRILSLSLYLFSILAVKIKICYIAVTFADYTGTSY